MLRLHEDESGGWRALRAERGVGPFCEQLERVPEMLYQSIEPGHEGVFCQRHNVWLVHVEEVQGTAAEHVMHEHEPAVIGVVRGGAALRLRHALFMSDVELDELPSLCFDRHRWRAAEVVTRLDWKAAPYQIRLHRVVIVVRKQVLHTLVSVYLLVVRAGIPSERGACVHAGYARAAAAGGAQPTRAAAVAARLRQRVLHQRHPWAP
jgi:hypothetical protein